MMFSRTIRGLPIQEREPISFVARCSVHVVQEVDAVEGISAVRVHEVVTVSMKDC